MNALIDFAARKITDVGLSITSGNADIDPICDGDIKSCEYCDYRSVCNFDASGKDGKKLEALPELFLKED